MKLYRELAEYYFAIENNHRDIGDDIALVRETAGPAGLRILDLGCGTGEHLDRLRQEGYVCTGMDSSEEMLAVAKRRFPTGIAFVHGSMCELDYYDEFDTVMSLFGSFDYLLDNADLEAAFWGMYRALAPGGTGLLEVWNASPILKIRRKPLGHVSTTTFGNTVIERKRGFSIVSDSDRVVVEVDYQYLVTDGMGTRTLTDRHRMRAFTREEIEALIKDNGFIMTALYSGSGKEAYNELSNKIIALFRKA